ncbi:TrkA family potassium uptake protein [Nostocoides vanveenii]|uniref:TrkA family potassium uptake protein n=2 Tax=Intrasporangiaceae TaxID=85021 RepID=A0ABN2KLD6_9MICO
MAKDKLSHEPVMVIGLGRFGAATAQALTALGHDVLAIERDPVLVQEWAPRLTHVIEADATHLEALEQLGARDFPMAVVSIGGSVESSVLATANLVDLGCPQIWAKAVTTSHGRILERIGAHHVVYPEGDAGRRVARLLSGRMIEYMPFEDDFAIATMRPPLETQGFTLSQSEIRGRYGVTVVGLKAPGKDFVYAQAHTKVTPYDLLVVAGEPGKIERLAARP